MHHLKPFLCFVAGYRQTSGQEVQNQIGSISMTFAMNFPFEYAWRTFSIAICRKHLMALQIITLICLVSVTQPFYLKNYKENHQVTND